MKVTSQPARVLIVEDEAIISLDIKRLLSASGYAVAGAVASADQAIRAIELAPPDLVLMDIHIRGTADGIETALRIRKDYKLPVVFVTAHADKKTLDRARQTEPFGYIVKPISALSLTGTIEMALHKHMIERKLEEHSAWLTTVLQGIPDAVLVTDLAGEVQFLNSTAEQLLGVLPGEAVGKSVDSVLVLSSGSQTNVATQALDKAEWGSRATFPRDTMLSVRDNARVHVEGDVAISYADGQPAGAIFTLRDVSLREQEEAILRQEERMLALGQLTAGIAGDFSSLHTLLNTTCHELSNLAADLTGEQRSALLEKTDTIYRVSAMGLLMSGQLSQLNLPLSVRATYVSASGVVASVEPLLTKLRGGSLQVDIHLTDESTLVLCHPDRLQMLLLNVFLNARERMAGSGRIRVSTSQVLGNRVAITFEIEHIGISAWKPLSFPLEMENPDFSLSIAQAIVAAMQGSISFRAVSDTQGCLEILLPLQNATQDFVDAMNRRGTAMLIGSDLEITGKLEEMLEDARYSVIRCSSAAEALLLGQLHDNRIDIVIGDVESISMSNRRKLRNFFFSRNAKTKFIRLVPERLSEELGWQSLAKHPQSSAAERLGVMLGLSGRQMSASG